MDQRNPLLQCSHRILVGWGASKSDVLGRAGCGRSGGDCLVSESLWRFGLPSLPHFLDVFVERVAFRLQSFPFARPDICAEHLALDSLALTFQMRQQFLIVLVKFADGPLDRAPRRDPEIPTFAPPSPHRASMPPRSRLGPDGGAVRPGRRVLTR